MAFAVAVFAVSTLSATGLAAASSAQTGPLDVGASADQQGAGADVVAGRGGGLAAGERAGAAPGEAGGAGVADAVGPASVGDRVWSDADADGIQDVGEAGVAGVTVELLDGGNAVVATDTTDGAGAYLFDQLAPGTYTLRFTVPAGMKVSPPDEGLDDALDSDVDPFTGQTPSTSLAAGEVDLSFDLGLFTSVAIGDRVWEDLDGDGVQDAGEPGIAGVVVGLLDGSGTWTGDVAVTDASGLYRFDQPWPSVYGVMVGLPAGYDGYSPADVGSDDTVDSDVDPSTGHTALTTLVSGEDDTTWDAGVYRLASIGDRVWLDRDADGIQDEAEPGVAGVTVELLDGNGGVVATTTTDVDGAYRFEDLVPGGYRLRFVVPDGRVATQRDAGADDTADSDADPATGLTAAIALGSGQDDTTWSLGLVGSGDLSLVKEVVEVDVAAARVVWRITVTNVGADAAVPPIVITDVLPNGLAFVSATGGSWVCSDVDGTVRCTAGQAMQAGASSTVEITTAFAVGATGEIVNEAEVTSPNAAGTPGNDRDAAAAALGQPTPSTTSTSSPTTTSNPPPGPSSSAPTGPAPVASRGSLPVTGQGVAGGIGLGIALLGAGALVLAVRRRHRGIVG